MLRFSGFVLGSVSSVLDSIRWNCGAANTNTYTLKDFSINWMHVSIMSKLSSPIIIKFSVGADEEMYVQCGVVVRYVEVTL